MTTHIVPMYRHPQASPNDPVTLHQGPVTLQHTKGTAQGTGTLVLRWFPTTGLRLECDVAAPEPGEQVKAAIAGGVADVLVSAVQMDVKSGVMSVTSSGRVKSFETGTGTVLASIGFQVLNFSDFLTPGPRPAPVFGYPPHIADLDYDIWRVRLTAVEDSTALFKNLNQIGGYAFTHLGRLERHDGTAFAAQDTEDVLQALTRFLCFARGAVCNLPVRWGVDNGGTVVWERWGSPVIDPWKGHSQTWFDDLHGNLLSETFPAFATTLLDPNLGPPFSLALHWYQKCNTRAGGMEGAIILGLTALDLLGALVVVDRTATMSESKYDKLRAAAKLAKLLQVIGVSAGIPPNHTNLAAFASANGWTDATEALAEIRHGYVHANKKRRNVVLSASNLATFEFMPYGVSSP